MSSPPAYKKSHGRASHLGPQPVVGYGPSGIVGVIVVALIILLVMGRFDQSLRLQLKEGSRTQSPRETHPAALKYTSQGCRGTTF